MVEFTDGFRERMRRKLAWYAEKDREKKASSKLRLTVDKGDDQTSVATVTPVSGPPFTWTSEERGPSPLAYFLSSMAMCQCVHYAEHAAAENIRIESLRIDIEGTYSVSHPRSFEAIDYTVRIQSPENPSTIQKLFETAASDCYVTGTLRKACHVEGRLVLNGKET